MKIINREINSLDSKLENQIELYLDSHQDSTFYHYPKWQRLLSKEFNKKDLKFSYDIIMNSAKIVGIFPSITRKRFLFFNDLNSPKQSFMTPYGGPICNNIDVFNFIIDNKYKSFFRKKINLSLYPVKNSESHYFKELSFNHISYQETAILRIGKSEEDMLSQMSRNHRRNIKKFEKNNIITEDNLDNLNSFYKIYLQHCLYNNLVPISKDFIINIFDTFACRLIVMKSNGRTIGATIFIEHKNMINAFIHAVDSSYVSTGCGYSPYWFIIKENIGKNKILDFTVIEREKNKGIARFKLGWGSEIIEFINITMSKYKY